MWKWYHKVLFAYLFLTTFAIGLTQPLVTGVVALVMSGCLIDMYRRRKGFPLYVAMAVLFEGLYAGTHGEPFFYVLTHLLPVIVFIAPTLYRPLDNPAHTRYNGDR